MNEVMTMKRSPAAILLALLVVFAGCKKEDSSANSTTAAGGAAAAASHEGQGQVVTADPVFDIKLKLGETGASFTFASQQLGVYESRKPAAGQAQRPQGFELRGENFVLAGKLPDDLKLAPQQKYEMLVDQPLAVLPRGGDPSMLAMSKITTSDGKVYVAKSGTITPTKAFNRGDAYAGLSGNIECELQEIKLGNPDEPNNKGDQPVGDPIKATGTFTAKAVSYPFEQL
jgi:hypothetical protein